MCQFKVLLRFIQEWTRLEKENQRKQSNGCEQLKRYLPRDRFGNQGDMDVDLIEKWRNP